MSPDTYLFATLGIPLVTGILGLVFVRHQLLATLTSLLAGVLQLAASLMLLAEVDAAGYVVVQAGDWPAPFGISLVADRLAAAMVAITGIIGLAAGIYAFFNREQRLKLPVYYPLSNLMLLGVNGAFLTGDLFNLFVWFEVMLIASFVLMVTGFSKAQLDGGVKYVLINLFSSAIFLIGVGILYGKLGTLNMADIAAKLADAQDPLLLNTTNTLLLVAFAIKAGLFPFFFWLPASYHTPAFVVSSLFAALLTKVGVYAMMRAQLLLFAPNFTSMQTLLAVLAAATMVTGVLGAAAYFHTRRILSFHIISQIGYMIMGLAIATPLAIAGTIFYLLHHILVKTNLFFIAGLIHRLTGREDLAKLGGLVKSAPWLAVLFLIPALSLAGIPPLSGFWAKLLVVKASLEAGWIWLAITALLVGALTLFSMTKIWNEAFWKKPPADDNLPPRQDTPGWLAYSPVIALAALTVIIGVTVTPLFAYSQRAAEQLLAPTTYIEQVMTPQAIIEEKK